MKRESRGEQEATRIAKLVRRLGIWLWLRRNGISQEELDVANRHDGCLFNGTAKNAG